MSIEQLYWLETVLKATAGLTLVLMPIPAIIVAGMPRPVSSIWPRMLGGVLIGLAIAIFIALKYPETKVIGPAGLAAINLCGGGAMAANLMLGTAATTRRGKFFILANTLLLLAFGFVEIAYI